jgi:hypothetical protein
MYGVRVCKNWGCICRRQSLTAKATSVCLLRLLCFLSFCGYLKAELTDVRRRKISAEGPKILKLFLQHIGSSLLQEAGLHRTPVCVYTPYVHVTKGQQVLLVIPVSLI